MIKDLHKEEVCASCEYCGWGFEICDKHDEVVYPWNLCPDYKACQTWEDDPSPRSGPWVVPGI